MDTFGSVSRVCALTGAWEDPVANCRMFPAPLPIPRSRQRLRR